MGSSLTKLYKEESQDDEVRALYLISIAYEQVGLLWVSRGALLSAASLATSSFWNYGEINTMQAACYKRLKWLELRLGRISQALDWHYLDNYVRNILVAKGFYPKRLFEPVNSFDMAIGVLFLRSDLKTLKGLENLPDLLPELGLYFSTEALIYALGQEDHLSKEFTEAIPPEEYETFFTKWGQQYSPESLPPAITDTESVNIQLASTIMGCRITINTINESPCLDVAESILAALEGFMATTIVQEAVAVEEELTIYVDDEGKKDLIEHEIENGDRGTIVRVHCTKFNPHKVLITDQNKLSDNIFNIVIKITGRVMIFKDAEKSLTAMMRDERAQDRAMNFTGSFVTLGNVLGHQPKNRISDWTEGRTRYPLQRIAPLSFLEMEEENPISEESPSEQSFFRAKHTDVEISGIVRPELWDKAKWIGAGYVIEQRGKYPPVLAILFEDIESGKKIFSAWRKKIGFRDDEDRIRVSIVQGIDRKNPHHYRVGIGSNLQKHTGKKGIRFFVLMTRMHTMTPQSSKNLDMFKKAYKQLGVYILAPGTMGAEGMPNIEHREGIAKRELNFREAWEIGNNDLDSHLIIPSDDTPIIPVGVTDPPVVELLKTKKKYSKR